MKNPGLGGATTIAANVVALLTAVASVPYVAHVLLVVDAAAVAACLWVITRKKAVGAASQPGAGGVERLQYEWGQGARWLARAALLLLLPCTVILAYQVLPNRLTGLRSLRGSLCQGPSETPMAGAAVDAVSGVDSSVAAAEGQTDDYGYFFIDLKPWARRPRQLLVSTKECGVVRVPIGRPVREQSLCASVPEQALPVADRGPVWRISCLERERIP